MMNIKKTLLITLALLLINGCSELFNNQKGTYFTSQVSLNSSKLNPSITKEMIHFIEKHYPIANTTFYFQLDSSSYSQGASIEDALRNVGYGVSYIKKKGRIPFAYKIDFINKSILRTTYNIGSSTLSRLYRIKRDQAEPISPFTTRGFKTQVYQSESSQSYNLTKQAIVLAYVLNTRDEPSSKGKRIGKYYKDTILYVEDPIINDKGEQWSRVIETNLDGNNIQNRYISSRYIQYLN